jgi:hypothetical protein
LVIENIYSDKMLWPDKRLWPSDPGGKPLDFIRRQAGCSGNCVRRHFVLQKVPGDLDNPRLPSFL